MHEAMLVRSSTYTMAERLHIAPAMRTSTYLTSILTLLLGASIVCAARAPQEGVNVRGIVESAEIVGVNEDEIGQDIRDDVHGMAGQRFDQQAADTLVARIQADLPTFIVTARLAPGSQSDRVKVLFVVEAAGSESNINSRYTVERVEVQGFDESKLSQAVRDDMKKLVGEKLDQDKANDVLHRLEMELRPRRTVVKRVTKGSDRQHIVVVYEIKNVRWIPFVDVLQMPRAIVHSKQNFSFGANANIFDDSDGRLNRATEPSPMPSKRFVPAPSISWRNRSAARKCSWSSRMRWSKPAFGARTNVSVKSSAMGRR